MDMDDSEFELEHCLNPNDIPLEGNRKLYAPLPNSRYKYTTVAVYTFSLAIEAAIALESESHSRNDLLSKLDTVMESLYDLAELIRTPYDIKRLPYINIGQIDRTIRLE